MHIGIRKRVLFTSVLTVILLASFLLAPLVGMIPVVKGDPEAWWNTNWLYRKEITIDHTKVYNNFTNFPLLLDLSDQGLADHAQSSGNDIVFVEAQTGVKLDHEIERFDHNTGHLTSWVSLPTLSQALDKKMYMYYGNPSAESQQNPASVWNTSFSMVQHLEEASGTRYDSTGNDNDATPSGGVSKDSSGMIDGADAFDGLSSSLRQTTLNLFGENEIMIDSWVRINSIPAKIRYSKTHMYGRALPAPLYWYGLYAILPSNSPVDRVTLTIKLYNSGTASLQTYSYNVNIVDQWVHVAWGLSKTTKKTYFYVNGQLVKSDDIASTLASGFTTPLDDSAVKGFSIGSNINWQESAKIACDETRVSRTTRSADWMRTSYSNQRDPASFYTIGVEETAQDTPPQVSNESPQNGATDIPTNPTLSVYASDLDGDAMTLAFRTNATGMWQDISGFSDILAGTYKCVPTSMNKVGTKYFWMVCASDGESWTNRTFTFTTTTTVLKQKWVSSVPQSNGGVLIADVTGNKLEEVIQAGVGRLTVLNGTDGSVVWSVSVTGAVEDMDTQTADLNNDGHLEIILPLKNPAGVHVFYGDGRTFWRNDDLSGDMFSSPVVHDIDGSGYPTIFTATMCALGTGYEGGGRISALSWSGQLLRDVWIWHPCAGGLSLDDADGDGEYELYVGDRNADYGDGGYGRGVQSFWARNLTLRWYDPQVLCSSHIPMLADVNGDGVRDTIIGHHRGGIAVYDSRTGSVIRKTLGISNDAPVHYQPTVYDIDGDGHLELLMADGTHTTNTHDIVVWDLVDWRVDWRAYVGACYYGPRVADVTGDGILDIIACDLYGINVFENRLNNNYVLIANITGTSGWLTYPVVQDMDGDGYLELVVTSSSGRAYAYDTPARAPAKRIRSEVQFYSERRLGAAEYVSPPGRQAPVVSDPSPADKAKNVPISTSQLAFTLTDFQKDKMTYAVTTNPFIGSGSGSNVANGRYTVPITGLEYGKIYTWHVNVTDGLNWTNQTYTFTTESTHPWWNTTWQYRRQITTNHNQITQDQTDFPLLIDITDSNLVGKPQSDGDDFAFTDNSENKLDHQIELYDFNTGHLIAWVRIPLLSASTDAVLYIYYGNPTAENQQNTTAVWDTSHRLVLHLNENYGPHECRLWGIIANTIPETVTMDHLVNLPYSLKNLGGGVQANDDGWGLAYYASTEPTVLRGEPPAYTDPNFNTAAQQLAQSGASIAVGHVRNAASGATEIPDPHPFIRYKNGKWWSFGHNGVLSKTILKNLIGPEYLALNPPTVGTDWNDPDVIDSDLYMLYVLKRIEQAGWNVTIGIADAVTAISKLDSGAMNFFLSDGQTLWGFCRGRTLYYYYDGAYSALASQPPTATQGSWIALSDFNLVKLTKTAPPQVITDIRDYDPLPQCYDSTINANNGNLNNDVTQAITGQIDGAYQFDGVNDYIEIPHSNTLSGFTTGLTLSFWLRLDDTARRQTILNKYNSGTGQRSWYIEFQTHATYGKVISFFASQDGTNYREWHTRLTPTAGTWYYITVVWAPATVPKFYVNGVQTPTLGTNTVASIYNNVGVPLLIGRCPYNTARYLRGGLDEIRISNPARSAAYILTSYNNQKNPATFYSLSSEEALPSAPIVSEPSPENGATSIPITQNTLSFNLTDYQETMTYYVTTTPDIGQDTQPNVPNGRYAVTISNLQYATTYTWHVDVTDGTHWTNATFTFTTQAEPRLLVDPQFDDSADSVALRANGAGQDWYESRGAFSGGDPTLLTLDTASIGGDTGKKAALKNYGIISNAYLTQEFNTAQTSSFDLSFDIFIDRIQDSANYDRTGNIYLGDDRITTNCPTGTSDERFVCLAFYDPTPGDTGNDIILKARTLSGQSFATTSQWITVATGLNYDAWITIKLTINPASGTYDVYVDGILKGTFNKYSGYTPTQITYISFVADSDARGDFYVDNIFAPSMDRYRLTVTTVGSGTVSQSPGEASYAPGATVTLTATPAEGCEFQGWSGDLSGNVSPTTITMNGNKAVTATFTQAASYDDVIFDSHFDMGNLKNVQYQSGDASGNRFYTGEQNHTTVSFSDKHWWFYFSMDNVDGKTVTIRLVNNEAIDFSGNRWPEIEPVYSFDNINWERLPLSNVVVDGTALTFQMTVPSSLTSGHSKIWLAPLPPYTIGRRDALFAEFASSPYLEVTSLGTTPGGQELKVATITDKTYSDVGKIKAYVIAQQHAGEVPGSWEADGMIRFLLSSDPTAQAIRRSYIFRIVPITNVDGVFYGVSRYTPLRSGTQYDLNRWWSYDVSAMPFEIAKIYTDIQAFQPSSFNDMHSTINTEMGSPKDAVTYTWSTSDPTVVAFLDSIGDAGWPDTQRGTSGYACSQVHSRLGVVRSISWENPMDEFVTNPGHKLTVNDWKDMGRAYAIGVYLDGGDRPNTAPTATDLQLNPADPKTNDDLTASYVYADTEGDPENGTEIRWYKNGELQPTLNNSMTVSASLTQKGDVWYFTVKPKDSIVFGDVAQSASVEILNTPPAIVTSNPTEDPTIMEGESQWFNVTHSDIDGDTVTVQWYLDGVPTVGSDSYLFTAGVGSAGSYNVTVVVTDSEAQDSHQWTLLVLSIPNTPPEASNLSLSPTDPKTDDDLTASYTYSDADGDPEAGTEIRWYKNGELQSGLNDNMTVSASLTQKDDVWYFTVKPRDGKEFGSIETSATVAVLNTAPEASGLSITPSSPTTAEDLTATYAYLDADGDTEAGSEIRWFKNGVLQTDLNDLSVVSASLTSRGDVWYFTVTPRDGADFGTTQASSEITVQNSPPAFDSKYPATNPTILEGDSQVFNVTCSDADGDSLLVRWLLNGVDVSTGNAYTFSSDYTSSGTYNVTVVATDGSAEAKFEWTLTVTDVGPVLDMPFDASGTPTPDNSGYGNNGAVNGATWTTAGNGSYYFDGNDYIQIVDSTSLDGNGAWDQLTVEFWIYMTASGQNGKRLIAKRGSTSGTYSYQVGFQTANGQLYFDVWNPAIYEVECTSSLSLRTWYHVTCVYKSGVGSRIYLNGANTTVLVKSGAGTGNVAASRGQSLFIGCRYGTQDFFTGIVDNVRIFSKGLPANQIVSHYESSRSVHVNTAPVITSYTPVDLTPEVSEGGSLQFTQTSIDPERNPLSYAWMLDDMPVAVTQNWTYYPTFSEAGFHNVTLLVNDGSLSTTMSWNVTVNNVNRPPTITGYYPAIDPTVPESTSQEFNVTCQDPDGDALLIQWYLDNTPTGTQNSTAYTFPPSSAGTYYVAVAVSDGQAAVWHNWTLTVTATVRYALTITIVGDGQVTRDPDETTYELGTMVTLTASATLGWTFDGWSGDLTDTTNPINITMDGDKAITATFTQNQYTLTVIIIGNGSVVKTPDQTTYTYGSEVQLTATPEEGWSFSDWSGDLVGSTNPANLTMDSNKTVTATFTQNQYTLTINVVGSGTVSKDPDQATYTHGTVVTLTATPATGWSFSGWSGDLSGNTNPVTITMTSSKTVTATFLQILLADSNFDASVSDADLRTNGAGQDWYESRGQNASKLTLDASDVSGNSGNKAKLSGGTVSTTDNVYLSQEFVSAQTGTFTVQWDIYVDSILTPYNPASNPYRAGWMLIGDDLTATTLGPNSDNAERFVYLAFYKPGGGTSGTMDLVGRDRDDGWTAFSTVATGLNLKQWYTIKVVCNMIADTYDVYVDGVYKATLTSRNAKTSVTHISFATWHDGAGIFYVDNVFAPAVDTYKLAVNTDGHGSIIVNPGESSYTFGTVVSLTPVADSGYVFDHWELDGVPVGSDEPYYVTMDGSKTVTAFFRSSG